MAASSAGNHGGVFGPTRSVLLSFCAAFFFGGCLTYIVVRRFDSGQNFVELDSLGRRILELSDPHGHVEVVDDSNRVSRNELLTFKGHTHARQFGQDVLADILYKQVRILCWVLTSPQNLQKKTIHVQATWSRRCNKVIFISSRDDPSFPTVKVEAPEGREYLWRKTRGAFKYVYDHHLDEADWFLKADDDTYVVLENLRYLLADKDPNDPVYYGRKFKPYVKQGYMSGGAGYVLSKAALVLAVEKAFPNAALCRSDAKAAGAAEDVEIGKCLSRVGVTAGDSRDSLGRERFHPFIPEHHLIKGIVPTKFWYWDYCYYPAQARNTEYAKCSNMWGRCSRRHAPRGGPIRKVIIQFCAAFVVGICATHVLINRDSDLAEVVRQVVSSTEVVVESDNHEGHAQVNRANEVAKEELLSFKSHTHAREHGQDLLADALYDRVRILCWILTSPQNLQKKAIHVQATWSRRCNKVIFISSQDDPSFPTVNVKAPEGRAFLWQKTRGAFQYIYDHHLNDADWFLKADDDTYVVLENLRYILADKSSEEPVYFGRRFKAYVSQGYMSGGAGYVLSKLALILVVEQGFPNLKFCKGAGNGRGYDAQEDLEIGRCLETVGVVAGDSRDSVGKETFHPFQFITHILPNQMKKSFWFWKYAYYPAQTGPECCSDYSISFHYISPNNMYLLEYMIYHMRPFGVGHYTCPANMDAIISKVLPANSQQDRLGKAGEVAGEVGLTNNEVGGHDKVIGGQVRSGIQEGDAANLMN
ncbi:uncharacterized protein LOC119719683 [Patiria miniata]|uniref:Glycoprotein-N-acetylgalactosamine 3-beta-galactosyltransferase 1 n=1 Tax=Patiria miniata TaxID=46514 RepID=A0A913Z279_PATMI|nr:uncharacterized protein LOC119719683 [Patiria miniata]